MGYRTYSIAGTTSSVRDYALLPGNYPHQQGKLNYTSHTPSRLVTAHFVAVTDSMSPPDGGGTSIHNPQPALGLPTASQPSEGPASPEDIPTEDATPPGGHHVPSSGENPTSPAEAAEPAILGGF